MAVCVCGCEEWRGGGRVRRGRGGRRRGKEGGRERVSGKRDHQMGCVCTREGDGVCPLKRGKWGVCAQERKGGGGGGEGGCQTYLHHTSISPCDIRVRRIHMSSIYKNAIQINIVVVILVCCFECKAHPITTCREGEV